MATDKEVQTVEAVEETQLMQIVRESGLEKTKADFILEKFQDYFKMASEWERRAKEIKVTDETQTELMRMNGEGRKLLKKKRVDVENTRKELKEQSIREGRAIDGIANVLKALIVPIEQALEESEKFIERKQERERAVREIGRRELIAKEELSEFIPVTTDLRNMTDEDFSRLTKGARAAKEQELKDKLAAAEKARVDALHNTRKESIIDIWSFVPEQYRGANFGEMTESEFGAVKDMALEAENEKRLDDLRLREENERLEKARKAAEDKARKEKAAAEKAAKDAQDRIRKANEAAAAAKAELDAKRQQEAEEERKREAERKKAERAPDKVKVLAAIAQIKNDAEAIIKGLSFKSAACEEMLADAYREVVAVLEKYRKKAGEL